MVIYHIVFHSRV